MPNLSYKSTLLSWLQFSMQQVKDPLKLESRSATTVVIF